MRNPQARRYRQVEDIDHPAKDWATEAFRTDGSDQGGAYGLAKVATGTTRRSALSEPQPAALGQSANFRLRRRFDLCVRRSLFLFQPLSIRVARIEHIPQPISDEVDGYDNAQQRDAWILTDAGFIHANLPTAPKYEVDQISRAAALAAAGLGITALPTMTFAMFNADELAAVPLVAPTIRRSIGIAWLKDRPLSASAIKFVAALRSGSAWGCRAGYRPASAADCGARNVCFPALCQSRLVAQRVPRRRLTWWQPAKRLSRCLAGSRRSMLPGVSKAGFALSSGIW